MFTNDTLSQLKQLKQDIRANQDIAQGEVRGTKGKFGFVNLDDGREAFLPPDEMLRVFPGDRVEVSLTTSGGEKVNGNKTKIKVVAKLEKLISSDLGSFVGRYVVRGKGHFVEPDLPQFSRWTFLPPKNRGKAKDGDYIYCKISRHPYHQDGKGQAHVIERLGGPDDKAIEHHYTTSKYQLPKQWPENTEALSEAIHSQLTEQLAEREDLSALAFASIDNESTLDMDDALYAEAVDGGWKLQVAIADPSALIEAGSPLDKEAQKRASTVYLPGEALNMLPDNLSFNTFSLCANEARLVLLVSLNIAADGRITDYQFREAKITSQQKLSYTQVNDYLAGNQEQGTEFSPELLSSLKALHDIAVARLSYRKAHALIMNHPDDHELELNEQGKIIQILRKPHGPAHQVVEEAMLASNICAGEFLHANKAGLFSTHSGFRQDRLDSVKLLLNEALSPTEHDQDTLLSLEGYRQSIRTLAEQEEHAGTLGSLRRMLSPGVISAEHKAHLGLGLAHYATITSPIRRYHDLHNHRAIKRLIQDQSVEASSDTLAEQLQNQISTGRQAKRAMEQWLHRQYMSDKVGQSFSGQVVLINSQGMGVRLDDNGIVGFVLLREGDNKPEFDQQRLKISLSGQTYQPDQCVQVQVKSVDVQQKNIQLSLIAQKESE